MQDVVKKIIRLNQNLLGEDIVFKRINAGFANITFDLSDKYVLKICNDENNEEYFFNEIEYYQKYFIDADMPQLYVSDITKEKVQYMYSIMEKLEGYTLYHQWYKFSENEKEQVIEKLMNILKKIHDVKTEPFDWAAYIKNNISNYLARLQEMKLVNEKEYRLVKKASNKMSRYLGSDSFSLIHGDVHFDNVFYHDSKLKIIDFERCLSAPIDYEFYRLYRSQEIPFKWASEETANYNTKEKYKNIREYIFRHYSELEDIPYFDIRMDIYTLEDDLRVFGLCPDDVDLRKSVINISRKIVELQR